MARLPAHGRLLCARGTYKGSETLVPLSLEEQGGPWERGRVRTAPEVNRLVTARGWGVEEPLSCAGSAFCPALHAHLWSFVGPRRALASAPWPVPPNGSHPPPHRPLFLLTRRNFCSSLQRSASSLSPQ